jgi:hypothetical protein
MAQCPNVFPEIIFNIIQAFEIQSRTRQSDAALVASLPEYLDGFMLPPFYIK